MGGWVGGLEDLLDEGEVPQLAPLVLGVHAVLILLADGGQELSRGFKFLEVQGQFEFLVGVAGDHQGFFFVALLFEKVGGWVGCVGREEENCLVGVAGDHQGFFFIPLSRWVGGWCGWGEENCLVGVAGDHQGFFLVALLFGKVDGWVGGLNEVL